MKPQVRRLKVMKRYKDFKTWKRQWPVPVVPRTADWLITVISEAYANITDDKVTDENALFHL